MMLAKRRGRTIALAVHVPKRLRKKTPAAPPLFELAPAEAGELVSVFAPPRWLRDLGRMCWLLLGVLALLAVLGWLLGTTETIVGPVVAGTIVATVAGPVVHRLTRHMPRAAAAVIVLLALAAIAAAVTVLVIGGITSQQDSISQHASGGADRIEGWLNDLGVDKSGSASANSDVKHDVPQIISTLLKGVIAGIQGLTSLAFALSFTLLSLFFLLKDGPTMRRWVDRHLGVPPPVATLITGGVIRSLRGYFLGVTLVAAFNGIVVGIAALLLGVPLAGTIGVVTFITAYVPFIGAFVAGAFAVIIALGAKGTTIALVMLVIVILANGLLQNIFQPFAMGSALDLHPLAVLVLTIGAGCLFGMIGLVLAAPLASAVVHISRDLARARVAAAQADDGGVVADAPA
jgi:predicted PurR-regulated permease PerM